MKLLPFPPESVGGKEGKKWELVNAQDVVASVWQLYQSVSWGPMRSVTSLPQFVCAHKVPTFTANEDKYTKWLADYVPIRVLFQAPACGRNFMHPNGCTGFALNNWTFGLAVISKTLGTALNLAWISVFLSSLSPHPTGTARWSQRINIWTSFWEGFTDVPKSLLSGKCKLWDKMAQSIRVQVAHSTWQPYHSNLRHFQCMHGWDYERMTKSTWRSCQLCEGGCLFF